MFKFSLVLVFISFFFSELHSGKLINYSTDSDTLFCGRKISFTKINPYDTLSIYFSLDSGKSWKLITNDFDKQVDWIVPFTLKKNLIIKTKQHKIQPMQLIWEVPNAHLGEIRSIDFSTNGKLLLTLGRDGLIKVWDIEQRKAIDSIGISGTDYYYDAKFLKDPNKVIFTLQNRTVLWNRQNKSTDIFYTIGNFIRKIDLNPTNNNFSIITDDINLAVFNETFFLPIPINFKTFSKSQYANAYDLKYSVDGKQVLIATYNGKLLITNGNTEIPYSVDNKPIYSASFTNEPGLLAFGGASNQLGFYRTGEKSSFKVEPKFEMSIREIKFSKDRNEVLAGSLDSTLKIWSSKDFKYVPYFIKEPYGIFTIDITQTSDTIATAGRNNTFRIWLNYRDIGKEQIDTFSCLQEIFISVETEKENILPKELIKFKYFSESQYKDTLQKIGKWVIKSKVSFPYRSLNSYVYEGNLQNDKYQFSIDTNLRFKSEPISKWTFRSLYNNNIEEIIDINDVKIIPEDNFYPIVQKNTVSVDFICKTLTKIGFEPIPKIIRTEFFKDLIEIEFDSSILEKYDIFVSDYFGIIPKVYKNNDNPNLIRIDGLISKFFIINLKSSIYSITYKLIVE